MHVHIIMHDTDIFLGRPLSFENGEVSRPILILPIAPELIELTACSGIG